MRSKSKSFSAQNDCRVLISRKRTSWPFLVPLLLSTLGGQVGSWSYFWCRCVAACMVVSTMLPESVYVDRKARCGLFYLINVVIPVPWPCSQRAVLYCTWCTCAEGQFRPNLNIQPIRKINGISPQLPNHDWKPFNLIWAFFEWLEHEILEIWDFGKCTGPSVQKPAKKLGFENSPFARIQNPTFSHP